MIWSIWFVVCLGSNCEELPFVFDEPKYSQQACLKAGKKIMRHMFKKQKRYKLREWECTTGGRKIWVSY